MTITKNRISLDTLIQMGKKNGFLTVDEITKYVEVCNLNENEADELYKTCIDNQIEIKDNQIEALEESENSFSELESDDRSDFEKTYEPAFFQYESSLQIYLTEAKKINILPFEKQKELVREYKNGSKAAEHRLIENYLPLVIDIAKRYKGRGLSFDDLIQEGNLGLMKGLDKYDPDKGFMISTYVTFWIKQAITRAIADIGHMIRIPVHAYEVISKIQGIIKEYENQNGVLPTVQYISEKLEIPEVKIKEYIFYINNIDLVSLETPVKEDDDATLIEFIADPNTDETPDKYADIEGLRAALDEAFTHLPKRECEIIKLRFGFYGHPMTLEEVGDVYGITRERVRQIEAKVLRKLKSPRFAVHLRDYLK